MKIGPFFIRNAGNGKYVFDSVRGGFRMFQTDADAHNYMSHFMQLMGGRIKYELVHYDDYKKDL